MDWLTILLLVLVLIFTIYLVYSYAAKSTPPHIYFLVFCGWLLAFEIVALIPYDVYIAVSGDDPGPLRDIWTTMYWSVNGLCWVFLPLSQAYQVAGDFTFLSRMATAIFRHVRTYIVFGIAGGSILLYLLIAGKLTTTSASAILVVLSNLWGLFLVIVLLGYGLVEVPRKLWYAGSFAQSLKYRQFKASRLDESINNARYHLSNTLKQINAARRLAANDRELSKCIEILVAKSPPEDLEFHFQNRTHENPEVLEMMTPVTKEKLVKVHVELIKSKSELKRSKCRWNMLLNGYIKLEDIIASRNNPDWKITYTFKAPRVGCWGNFLDKTEWLWRCWISPVFCRVAAVVLAILGIFVVLGELTLFVDEPVGVFPIFFQDSYGPVGTQLLCIIPLSFMVLTTYFGLFNLKLQGLYGLYPHNNTDPHNLTWSAAFMARLASPLCYNILLFLKIKGSEFEKVIGVVNVVPVVGKDFAVFFPSILVVFVLMNLFNVYGKLMKKLGVSQFQFSEKFEDDQLDIGKSLLVKGKLKLQHKLSGDAMRAGLKASIEGIPRAGSLDLQPPKTDPKQPTKTDPKQPPAQAPRAVYQPPTAPSNYQPAKPASSGSSTMYERLRGNYKCLNQ